MKKYNTDEIKQRIISEIMVRKTWINKAEISRLIGIPRSTLHGLKIDSDVISAELGYPRTLINPKGSISSRDSVVKPIVDKYREMILSAKRPVTLYQLATELGMTEISQMSRIYRYGIDWKRIHQECGVEWHLNKKMPSCAETEAVLRDLIEKSKRYITRDELALKLGVSGSLLSFHRIRVDEINSEYGFAADGRGYELRILEMLRTLFPSVSFETQKTFADCRTSDDVRSRLRFDFYSPELNCLFEVDGPQHFDPNHFWYDESLLNRDRIKNEYAAENGFTLIRIRYDFKMDLETLKNLLSETPLKHSVGQSAAKPILQSAI
jgi:very-short-patch-repair endonuclease